MILDKKALQVAEANVVEAGVDEWIELARAPMETLKAPVESGVLIVDPPFGDRMGDRGHALRYLQRSRAYHESWIQRLGLLRTQRFAGTFAGDEVEGGEKVPAPPWGRSSAGS